jgi:hypothetical protein
MPDELIMALKERAEVEGISFSGLVIRYCQYGLTSKPEPASAIQASSGIADELYSLKERMDALEKQSA